MSVGSDTRTSTEGEEVTPGGITDKARRRLQEVRLKEER